MIEPEKPEYVRQAESMGWTGMTNRGAPWWYGFPPHGATVDPKTRVRDGSGRCVLLETSPDTGGEQ